MKKIVTLTLLAALMLSLAACGTKQPPASEPDAAETEQAASPSVVIEEPQAAEMEDKEPEDVQDALPVEQPVSETVEPEKTEDSLGSEFMQAMDSYEAFMDEYVAFMKKYTQNPSDLSLLADYANYISEYSEFVANFDTWQSADMSAAELKYYMEVQARVSKKLLEIAG